MTRSPARLVGLGIALLSGCGDGAGPLVLVASVSISPETGLVLLGDTLQLTATPRDAAGNPVNARAVTFQTSHPAIATVTPAGVVTGVGVGTVTITAASEGHTATTNLSVKAGGRVGTLGGAISMMNGSVRLTIPSGALNGPEKVYVEPATDGPSDGRIIFGTPIRVGPATLQFGLPVDLAVQYQAGTVAAGVEPTLALYAVAGGQWGPINGGRVDALTRTVSAPIERVGVYGILAPGPVSAVTVSPAEVLVILAQTVNLAAEIRDAAGVVVTDRAVTWRSLDTTVARVYQNGMVYGTSLGATTVTATSGGVSASSAVSVGLSCTCLGPAASAASSCGCSAASPFDHP